MPALLNDDLIFIDPDNARYGKTAVPRLPKKLPDDILKAIAQLHSNDKDAPATPAQKPSGGDIGQPPRVPVPADDIVGGGRRLSGLIAAAKNTTSLKGTGIVSDDLSAPLPKGLRKWLSKPALKNGAAIIGAGALAIFGMMVFSEGVAIGALALAFGIAAPLAVTGVALAGIGAGSLKAASLLHKNRVAKPLLFAVGAAAGLAAFIGGAIFAQNALASRAAPPPEPVRSAVTFKSAALAPSFSKAGITVTPQAPAAAPQLNPSLVMKV